MVKLDNFEMDNEKGIVLVSINPKIYSLEVIFSSAYVLMDKAFIVIDGDPETEVVVSIRPKNSEKLESLASEFNDELLNYAVNTEQSRKTEQLRSNLIKEAFAGHSKKADSNEANNGESK